MIERKLNSYFQTSIFTDGSYLRIYHKGKKKIIEVGLAVIKLQYRGRGYFKKMLEDLKDDADIIYLNSPTLQTQMISTIAGYKYIPQKDKNNYPKMVFKN